MSLDLDDETREQLGMRNPWDELLRAIEAVREAKLSGDRKRIREARESLWVKLHEAAYQREYAKTEAGKERRRAAKQAYLKTPAGKEAERRAVKAYRARKKAS